MANPYDPLRDEFEKDYRLGPRDFSKWSVGEASQVLTDLSNTLFVILKSEAGFAMRHAVRSALGDSAARRAVDLLSSERVFRVAFYSTELDTLMTDLMGDRMAGAELQKSYDALNDRCDAAWKGHGGRIAFVREP